MINKPWDDEPDLVEGKFMDLPYRIERNTNTGSLNGYVTVPKENPFYGKDYNDITYDIRVHGGLTFSENFEYQTEFGFDTAHAGDLIPMMVELRVNMNELKSQFGDETQPEEWSETYKDVAYVEHECKKLCWQLAGKNFDTELNKALFKEYAGAPYDRNAPTKD